MGQNLSSKRALTQIRQEKAAAGKRLSRYRQSEEKIRRQNLALRRFLGFASQGDLGKTLMEKGVHPEGLAMFKKALEKRGKQLPEFLTRIPIPGSEQEAGDRLPSEVPGTRRSRVKFRL